jgi:hypothetical protein
MSKVIYIILQLGLLFIVSYLIGSLILNEIARTVWIPTTIAILMIIVQMILFRKWNIGKL